MGVLSRILYHLLGNRSLPPVGELVLLISQNSTVRLEQVSKTESFELKNPSSLTRVEHVNDIQIEISLEPLNIHISSMKHFLFLRIIEHTSECVTH